MCSRIEEPLCVHYESYQIICFLCIYKANIVCDIIAVRIQSTLQPDILQWNALWKNWLSVKQTKSVE